MNRAGRSTRERVRRDRATTARKNWRRYAVLAVFFAALGSVGVWSMHLWAGPVVAAFFAGVYVTTYCALISYSLMLDGSHHRMMGAEAEGWTSRELRKLDGWWVMDAVEFADRDVDHVAVGPAHVLAVETKWTSRGVTIDEHGVHGLWCDGLEAARRAAKRVEDLLASRGSRQPVIPVLVLWGGKVPELPEGYRRIGDVRVVVGGQADEWRQRIGRLPSWSRSTRGVPELITSYVEEFDRRTRPGALTRLRRRWSPA